MLFNSYVFIGAFLPITYAGFVLACRLGRRAAVAWLVAASLGFYGWWNPAFVPVLLISIAGNFLAARLILAAEGAARTTILIAAIALNLAALGWYKYLAAVFGLFDVPFQQPPLPLGITIF